MSRDEVKFNILPVLIAAVGFAAFAAVFIIELHTFHHAVIDWAERDLETRTKLAAVNLEGTLNAADWSELHVAGEIFREQGLRLTVYRGGDEGGLTYDSAGEIEDEDDYLYAEAESAGHHVRLGLPRPQVLAPFRKALLGFGWAALMGGAAVLLILFLTYRQHVRMRELAKVEKFRREFIADISHEIKTPLTGILGAVELLMDDPGEAARQKLLGMVKKEAVRLNALAQDVVGLAKLEHREAVHFERVDLRDVLREAAERFRARAAEVGMKIRVEAEECVEKVDAQLMARAVANLVENAIRYSKSADVVLSVKRTDEGVKVSVEDHGVGIGKEEAERIFERFYRADTSRTAATGGSGLGLAIVREIAAAHGGEARVERLVPHGCRFTMILPFN
jgi:signal transduction histidine kinase